MAITIDTANKLTAKTADAGAATLTIPAFVVPDTATTDSVLVVGASLGSDATITGITWNGLPFAQVGTAVNSTNCRADLWQLVSPSIEVTADIIITFSGSVRAAATAIRFAGVSTGLPFGTVRTATGSTLDATISHTKSEDDALLVVVIAKRDSTEADLTPGASSTQQGEMATADGTAALNVVHWMATEPVASGTQTVNATWSTTPREWAAIASQTFTPTANYTWNGPSYVQLQGWPTILMYGVDYDIPRSVLVPYGGSTTLHTGGIQAVTDDNRLVKT